MGPPFSPGYCVHDNCGSGSGAPGLEVDVDVDVAVPFLTQVQHK